MENVDRVRRVLERARLGLDPILEPRVVAKAIVELADAFATVTRERDEFALAADERDAAMDERDRVRRERDAMKPVYEAAIADWLGYYSDGRPYCAGDLDEAVEAALKAKEKQKRKNNG